MLGLSRWQFFVLPSLFPLHVPLHTVRRGKSFEIPPGGGSYGAAGLKDSKHHVRMHHV